MKLSKERRKSEEMWWASPQLSNESEHVSQYNFPLENFDAIIYTGFGLKGRNVVFVRTCDGVILVSGRIGTMNEFTIAHDEKKVVGVLTESGGISNMIKEITLLADKKGEIVLYVNDPVEIVKKVVDQLSSKD